MELVCGSDEGSEGGPAADNSVEARTGLVPDPCFLQAFHESGQNRLHRIGCFLPGIGPEWDSELDRLFSSGIP